MLNVLITGAGGPSGIGYLNAIKELNLNVIMADMDPCAAGLYLAPSILLPRATSNEFIPALLSAIEKYEIDIVVPTVDDEMLFINQERAKFDHVMLAMADSSLLDVCLDKWELYKRLKHTSLVPQASLAITTWREFPALIKPRIGAGSRGIEKVCDEADLVKKWQDGFLVQEYLPGREFSVDVFVNNDGLIIGIVPRERLKIDSGIAVTARTLYYPLLEDLAKKVINELSLKGLANLQFKEDKDGLPRLMEINPRNPGTMPLTIQSGINMPKLQILELMGNNIDTPQDFEEIVMVRHWQETYLTMDQFKRTE